MAVVSGSETIPRLSLLLSDTLSSSWLVAPIASAVSADAGAESVAGSPSPDSAAAVSGGGGALVQWFRWYHVELFSTWIAVGVVLTTL